MVFLMQPIGRSALLEEVGESFVPGPQVGIGHWWCAGGDGRAAAASASHATAARAGGERRSPDLVGQGGGSGKKGELFSDVRVVDGEDESSGKINLQALG